MKSAQKGNIPTIPQELVLEILNMYLTDIESTFHSMSTSEQQLFVRHMVYSDYAFPVKPKREALMFGKKSNESGKNLPDLSGQLEPNQEDLAAILLSLRAHPTSLRRR